MAGHRKATKPKGGGLKRVVKWTLALGAFGMVAGVATVAVAYALVDIPNPHENFQAETTTVYYSDGKHELGQFALQNRTSVALSDVPQHVQDAMVAAENRTFWTDAGLDPKGIVRAAWANFTGGSTQGASTITQQYVKILYLSQEQTYSRKIKEALLSIKIERELSKEEILQGYLNTIYFGRGAYGIEAAAHAYFDKPASKLSLREGAVLASILNSPGTMDPAIEKDNAAELLARYRYVLDGMAESGAIDAAEADKAGRKLPKLAEYEVTDTLGGPEGYLLRLVEEHMAAQGFSEDQIYGGGLEVITTFDFKAQQATRRAVNQIRPEGLKNLHVGISSVEPGTGALRAMYGGPDYVESQYNWAEAGGQPGSTFKPFGLAAGFRDGFTMNTYFDGDSPYDLPLSGEVENQGNKDYGPVNLRTATTRSINTAYVDMTLQMEDGPKKVIRAAEDAGVKEDSEDPLSPSGVVALGPQTVSVTEMAEGYATFAANGEQANWYVLEEVTDDGGQVRYQHKQETEQAFSRTVASNVTAALQNVVREQHGTGHDSVGDFGRPAAGKTGTATSEGGIVSSSWFVGYTPQLSTAVMYVRGDGNNELRGYLNPFFGGAYPAQTWEAAMIGALQGKPILGFPQPGHLIEENESTVSPEPTFTPTPTTEEPTTEEPSPSPSETSEEPSPSPTPSKTRGPKPKPSPSEEPSPTTTCDLIPPNCQDESSSSPETTESSNNGNGFGQGGGG